MSQVVDIVTAHVPVGAPLSADAMAYYRTVAESTAQNQAVATVKDSTVVQNAAKAALTDVLADEASTLAYWRGSDALTASSNLETLLPGVYKVDNRLVSAALELPRSRPGTLQTSDIGTTARVQTWTTLEDAGTDPGMYVRTKMSGQEWGEWIELATATPPAVKSAAVVLTTSVNGYQTKAQAANYRVPFRLAAPATRWRLHVANRDDAGNTAYTAPNLTINQAVFIGKHKLDAGAMTGQFDGAPFTNTAEYNFAIPNGNEVTSAWVDTPLPANTELLFSFSIYNPDGATLMSGMATSWWSAATGDKNRENVTLSRTDKTPLNIWLEVEVADDVPVLAWLGDSLLVGRNANASVHDSEAWAHGMLHGVAPRMYGIAGGRMSEWIADPDGLRWTRLEGLGRADAVVIQIGSNDTFDFTSTPGTLLSTMQDRLTQTVALVRKHIADKVYLATIMPRSNMTYSAEFLAALDSYNEWLRSLPLGALGCFDFAAAVADPADAHQLRAIYQSADKVHLTTAGYAAMARAIPGPVAITA